MHKIDIPERNLVKEIPSSIEEMNQDQYVYFISLVLDYFEGKLTVDKLKMLLAFRLLEINLNSRFYLLNEDLKQEVWQNIFIISQHLDSFFKEEERDGKMVKVFELNSIKNFIPVICGNFHGPQDALQDITFREYRMAHDFMKKYVKTGEEEHLNYMIAVLYRPKKRFLWIRKQFGNFNGDEKISFTSRSNPDLLKKRAGKISKLPLALRYCVFLFMTGCEDYLATGEPEIGDSKMKLSILYEKNEDSDEQEGIGLVGLLYSLAETKVFGTIEETDNQNLWDVMARLYQVMLQMKKMEKVYGTDKNV